MKLTLVTFAGKIDGELDWDPETGNLSGPQAEMIRSVAQEAQAAGIISIDPAPASFSITDPLKNRSEMAALLGNFWKLPPELADDYPVVENPILPDEGVY